MKKFFSFVASLLIVMCPGIAIAAITSLFVTNHDSNSVSVIDTTSKSLKAVIPVGNGPSGVAVDPLGRWAYISNTIDGTVSVIDIAKNSVTSTILTGPQPLGLALDPNGTRLYVSDYYMGVVSVIDTATKKPVGIVNVGNGPQGIVVAPDGKQAFVANTGDGTVTVIDTARKKVSAVIPVGKGPVGIDITPDGAVVIVTNKNEGTVSMIGTNSNSVIAIVPTGRSPEGVATTRTGRAYVANFLDNSVSVIDIAGLTNIRTIPVGTNPLGVGVGPSGEQVFVMNRNSNNISVIDTATNSVSATLPAGNAPLGFGKSAGPALMSVPATTFGSNAYDAISVPLLSPFPLFSKPLGVGDLSAGSLGLHFGMAPFGGPVDVRVAIYAPGIDPANYYIIKQDGGVQPLSSGLPVWRANVTGPIDEYLWGNIPLNILPLGIYYFYTIVTPSGRLDSYYLWPTSVTVPESVGGVVTTDVFNISAGDTKLVTSDLTVFASQAITIDGTLLVGEGLNVGLLSGGPVTINGRIIRNVTPSDIQVDSSVRKSKNFANIRDAGSGGGLVIAGSSHVQITSSAVIDSNSLKITTVNNGTLTIAGKIRTKNGKDGLVSSDNGGEAGTIEIGTQGVIEAIHNYGALSAPPLKVVISGALRTGDGGAGYSDEDGTTSGSTQVYKASNGGKGGDIAIAALDTIDLTGAVIQAGAGGDGGVCGFDPFGRQPADSPEYEPPTLDGEQPGEQGKDVTAASGDGGTGGSVILSAPNIIGTTATAGKGGDAGDIVLRAGNGGPGGRGGNLAAIIGNPGAPGTAPTPPDGQAEAGEIALENGGIGGNSTDPSFTGGDAGNVTITGRNGAPAQVRNIWAINYANGGSGFDACTGLTGGAGTDGGKGGMITTIGGQVTTRGDVAKGADGGDGEPWGKGGLAGSVNGVPGKQGNDGKGCFAPSPNPVTPPPPTPAPTTCWHNGTFSNCDGGCGIADFDVTAGTAVLADNFGANGPQAFDYNPPSPSTSATSQDQNLLIFGKTGHACSLNCGTSGVGGIYCQNPATGQTCVEACTYQ